MFEQPVRQLVERELDVFQTELLARNVERHMREASVHRAQHTRQHRSVAHAGIEQPQRRRARMDAAKLERDAIGDHTLLAAGVDE